MSGHGDKEFFSCRDEIIDSMNKGYPIVLVYRTLKDAKKITISDKRFYAILAKYGVRKRELPQMQFIGDCATMDKNHVEQALKSMELIPRNRQQRTGRTENLSATRAGSQPTVRDDSGFGIIKKTEDEVF